MEIEVYNKFLPSNAIWHITNTGFHVRTHDVENLLSNAELATIHPDLPAGVLLLTESKSTVRNLDISRMLLIWESNIHLRTMGGDFVALTYLNEVKVTNSMTLFLGSGYHYYLKKTRSPEKFLPLPLEEAPNRTAVSNDWLHSQHPGWKERYQVALELGCNVNQAVEHMLSVSPINPNVIIPEDLSLG